jgi:hypothetical protein
MSIQSQNKLTIVFHPTGDAMSIQLGGRITSLRAAQPGGPWADAAPGFVLTKLSLNDCDQTQVILRECFKS